MSRGLAAIRHNVEHRIVAKPRPQLVGAFAFLCENVQCPGALPLYGIMLYAVTSYASFSFSFPQLCLIVFFFKV